jgi:hypothetical protein
MYLTVDLSSVEASNHKYIQQQMYLTVSVSNGKKWGANAPHFILQRLI